MRILRQCWVPVPSMFKSPEGTTESLNAYPYPHADFNPCPFDAPPTCVDDHRYHSTQPWSLYLIDGDGGCNAFEAVAKFTACGETRLYPGGASSTFTNKNDVLTIFRALSWIEDVGEDCIVREDVFVYPPEPPDPPTPPCN